MSIIMFRKIMYTFAVIGAANTFATEISYTWEETSNDLAAPLIQKEAYPILVTGAAMTMALVVNRENIVEPIQVEVSTRKPLGKWSEFGDIMGQVVPNALYMGAMYADYKFSDSKRSLSRSTYMLKTTAYAGITTMILKRMIGQKRPNGGDNLSFPSGHTTTAFAFAAAVGMEHEWYWGVGAYSLAAFVGYSRINDNAHYLHDVVMGATIGISYGVALYYGAREKGVTYPIMMEDGMGIGTTLTF